MNEKELIEVIMKLKSSYINNVVKARVQEFKELGCRGNIEWFLELCFCILTAGSSAISALKAQKELGFNGFLTSTKDELVKRLKEAGCRFFDRRAEFIIEARKFKNIKDIMKRFPNEYEAREWLVKNVKGIGYKEASHFLRNVGFSNVAILDRHVLSLLRESGIIEYNLKTLTKRRYLEVERKLRDIAEKVGLSLAELDLYLWYVKTGKVLK